MLLVMPVLLVGQMATMARDGADVRGVMFALLAAATWVETLLALVGSDRAKVLLSHVQWIGTTCLLACGALLMAPPLPDAGGGVQAVAGGALLLLGVVQLLARHVPEGGPCGACRVCWTAS